MPWSLEFWDLSFMASIQHGHTTSASVTSQCQSCAWELSDTLPKPRPQASAVTYPCYCFSIKLEQVLFPYKWHIKSESKAVLWMAVHCNFLSYADKTEAEDFPYSENCLGSVSFSIVFEKNLQWDNKSISTTYQCYCLLSPRKKPGSSKHRYTSNITSLDNFWQL